MFALTFLLASLFCPTSCKKEAKEEMHQKIVFAFDTVCAIQLFTTKNEKETEPIFEEIFARLKGLELIFSPTRNESELYKLNMTKVGVPIQLSRELHYVIKENLKIAKLTEGAFNPCMGALTSLWRQLFNVEENEQAISLPSREELEEALKLSNYSKIRLDVDLDQSGVSTLLKEEPVLIDLGASAKGYATDCIKEIILRNGIKHAIIDFGGNIFALGKKENNKAWKIGIKMPIIHNEGRVAGFIEVEDKAVVTSGNYERFFEKDDKLYHHIISSKTGMPVDNELNAVSIISDSATLADLLSTACFVLGVEKGSILLNEFPHTSAIFFLKNGEVAEINNINTPFHIVDKSLRSR